MTLNLCSAGGEGRRKEEEEEEEETEVLVEDVRAGMSAGNY